MQDHIGVDGFLQQDGVDPIGVRGVRHHEILLLPQPVHDEVVDDPAPFVQHRVVLRAAPGDPGHVVGHGPLEGVERAGAGHDHLPQVHEVEQADPFPHGLVLGQGPPVLDGHGPAGERPDLGAQGPVLVLERGPLQGDGTGVGHGTKS